jgi:hypothetical protein
MRITAPATPDSSTAETRILAAIGALRADMEHRYDTCMEAIGELTKEVKVELVTAATDRRTYLKVEQTLQEICKKIFSSEEEEPTDMDEWGGLFQQLGGEPDGGADDGAGL